MEQTDLFEGVGMDAENALCAGVDEAGRGPLAGPVVAAAVILDPEKPIVGVNDSKKLTAKKRDLLYDEIKLNASAWSIAIADVEEIDNLNIFQATMVAMQRAVAGLEQRPSHVFVDGNHAPPFPVPASAIIKGDEKMACIGAASILAKVTRDRMMVELSETYPDYGFGVHKGYPTKQHMDALKKHGVTPVHRRSYKPVKALIEE